MNRLSNYKGYAVYLDTGTFLAFADESEQAMRGSQVASSDRLRGLHDAIDALESSAKRERVRPEFPVINSHGTKGTVKGIHAGTGKPNATMARGEGHQDTYTLYYDVPAARQMVEGRGALLAQALELAQELNAKYRLPSLGYGRESKGAESVASVEEDMRQAWASLSETTE